MEYKIVSDSRVDMNPPLVVHVEDEEGAQKTIKGFCGDLKLHYKYAETFIEAGNLIAQARGKAQDVLGFFDLNTKGAYQVDGDTIAAAVKASTRQGVEKTPIILHTGDPERGEREKQKLLKRFGADLGIFEVVDKMDAEKIALLLTAFKKRILGNVIRLSGEHKNIRSQEMLHLVERGGNLEELIAAFERRKTSDTSPQGNPS